MKSKTMPKGDARLLGTKAPKTTKRQHKTSTKQVSKDAGFLHEVIGEDVALIVTVEGVEPSQISSITYEGIALDADHILFKKVVDNAPDVDVDSLQTTSETEALSKTETLSDAAITLNSSHNTTQQEHTTMSTITLTRDAKPRKSTSIVFNSPSIKGGVRIAKSAFVDGVAPDTLDVSSDAFAQAKVKETKEERKERLKSAPKPTIAERAAKARARAEKLEAAAVKAAEQPTL